MSNSFLNFGPTEVPHHPADHPRSDHPCSAPSRSVPEILASLEKAIEVLWGNEEKLPKLGAPSSPELAVAFGYAVEGFVGFPRALHFPFLAPDGGSVRRFDLREPVRIDELRTDGHVLRDDLRGRGPDRLSLPFPSPTYDTAFLCFDVSSLPAAGAPHRRFDIPIRVPEKGTRWGPGEHPYGLQRLVDEAVTGHRATLLPTWEAARVIVGLPDHAGLAVTILALLHVFYAVPPSFAWPGSGGSYDLRSILNPMELMGRARKWKVRLGSAE